MKKFILFISFLMLVSISAPGLAEPVYNAVYVWIVDTLVNPRPPKPKSPLPTKSDKTDDTDLKDAIRLIDELQQLKGDLIRQEIVKKFHEEDILSFIEEVDRDIRRDEEHLQRIIECVSSGTEIIDPIKKVKYSDFAIESDIEFTGGRLAGLRMLCADLKVEAKEIENELYQLRSTLVKLPAQLTRLELARDQLLRQYSMAERARTNPSLASEKNVNSKLRAAQQSIALAKGELKKESSQAEQIVRIEFPKTETREEFQHRLVERACGFLGQTDTLVASHLNP